MMKASLDSKEFLDTTAIANANPQDYFKAYKLKMEALQKEKFIYQKDAKFHHYLTRLVDANKFKEIDRINGPQALNDFVLDKNSITQQRKVKRGMNYLQSLDASRIQLQEQMRSKTTLDQKRESQEYSSFLPQTDLYQIYGKEPIDITTYEPQIFSGLHEKNYVERKLKIRKLVLNERKLSKQHNGLGLLKRYDLLNKHEISNNSPAGINSRNNYDKPYQSIASNLKPHFKDFSIENTFQPSERSDLIKQDRPSIRARIPNIGGISRNSNSTAINIQSGPLTNEDASNRSNNIYRQESSTILIDMKKRDLISLKKANYYNHNVYDINISNLNKVKNMMQPQFDWRYQHSSIEEKPIQDMEVSILDSINKYNSIDQSSVKKTRFKYRINQADEKSIKDQRASSNLSLIQRISQEGSLMKQVKVKRQGNQSPLLLNTIDSSLTVGPSDKNMQQQLICFVEDGSCLQNCQPIKIDLTLFKQKYHIEPPKFISALPEEFKKMQKKFNKRALKELLEHCSQELASGKYSYKVLYTIEGNKIQTIEDIKEDCKLIILSKDDSKFKGIQNLKDGLTVKDLRIENAKDNKKTYKDQNNKFANKKYMDWVHRLGEKIADENLEITFEKHKDNKYQMNNSIYRSRIKSKLDGQASIFPTYQGGGLSNCKDFLLPELGKIKEGLIKLRSKTIESNKDGTMLSSRRTKDLLETLDRVRGRNSSKPPKLKMSSLQNQSLIHQQSNRNNLLMNSKSKLEQSSSRALQPSQSRYDVKQKDVAREQNKNTNLSYEECKLLSDEFLIPCKVVYELHAEFNSLLDVCKNKSKLIGGQTSSKGEIVENEEESSTVEEGIPLDAFKSSSQILTDKHDDFISRIISALGISSHNKGSKITWKTFLNFNSIMKYNTAPIEVFIDFWIKIFDPVGLKTVNKNDFNCFLEKLARGSLTETSTLISRKFQNGFYKMLVDKGCTKENGDILIDRLRKKLKKKEIDIEYLNQTLKADCEYILEDDDINFDA